jgi:hypothetical protein
MVTAPASKIASQLACPAESTPAARPTAAGIFSSQRTLPVFRSTPIQVNGADGSGSNPRVASEQPRIGCFMTTSGAPATSQSGAPRTSQRWAPVRASRPSVWNGERALHETGATTTVSSVASVSMRLGGSYCQRTAPEARSYEVIAPPTLASTASPTTWAGSTTPDAANTRRAGGAGWPPAVTPTQQHASTSSTTSQGLGRGREPPPGPISSSTALPAGASTPRSITTGPLEPAEPRPFTLPLCGANRQSSDLRDE